MAWLCLSFEVAREVLARRGRGLDIKTMRRLYARLGGLGLASRGLVTLSATERLAGKTLVIDIDGGRLCERWGKRGCKKVSQRRRGYHTKWREPKL
jgi:hypothetical protein